MWIHNESGELINTAHVRKFTTKQLTAANNTLTDSVVAQLHQGGEEVIVRHDPTGEADKDGSAEWCYGVIETIGAQMGDVIHVADAVPVVTAAEDEPDGETGAGDNGVDCKEGEPKDDHDTAAPKPKRGKKGEGDDIKIVTPDATDDTDTK